MDVKRQAPQPDYDRLKAINTELGEIADAKNACRLKISLFGALGGILVALSVIAMFHNILNSDDDWTSNPNSPVHAVASQDQSAFKVPIPLSLFGMFAGLALLYMAREKYALSSALNNREWSLAKEMRLLRDQMYPRQTEQSDRRFAPVGEEHTKPLEPEEARGEYLGLYSPPGSQKKAASG